MCDQRLRVCNKLSCTNYTPYYQYMNHWEEWHVACGMALLSAYDAWRRQQIAALLQQPACFHHAQVVAPIVQGSTRMLAVPMLLYCRLPYTVSQIHRQLID